MSDFPMWTSQPVGIQMLVDWAGADIDAETWNPIRRWDMCAPRIGDHINFSEADGRRIEGVVEDIVWEDEWVLVWVK